ncbi:hypothetical protein V8E53_003587 [Lactarius tabidus]
MSWYQKIGGSQENFGMSPRYFYFIPSMYGPCTLATSSASPHQFSLTICAALTIGKKAMNQYYNKTDHSNVYCWIAMSIVLLLLTILISKNAPSSPLLPQTPVLPPVQDTQLDAGYWEMEVLEDGPSLPGSPTSPTLMSVHSVTPELCYPSPVPLPLSPPPVQPISPSPSLPVPGPSSPILHVSTVTPVAPIPCPAFAV